MDFSLLDEVSDADLGDLRLEKRLGKIISAFGQRPNLSIPTACQSRKDMEAAYRFFDNDKVTPDQILKPHFDRSVERMAKTEVVVIVQDTTEVDLTRENQQVHGAGVMASTSMFGTFLHCVMAFNDQGVPLGSIWQKNWIRPSIDKSLTQDQKDKQRKEIPIEAKESIRWLEGLREARKAAEQCPNTTCVLASDSESDIYELFAEDRRTSHGRDLEMIVRGCHDRCTDGEYSKILATTRASGVKYECQVAIGSRKAKISGEERTRKKSRDARLVTVEVYATTVTLTPPARPDRTLPALTLNVVLVEEPNPPEGEKPIQWILITSLPIDSDEAIKSVVIYYCLRWGIEVYFKTLKSGCRVEERRFEELSREINCVAIYMIVAWRIMLMSRLGRDCPDMNCEVLFEPSEWKAIYRVTQRKDPPKVPPRLNDMIRMVATLGGYIRRKGSEPGTQTLWIGTQRMYDMANCWEIFGPESKLPSPTCVV